MARDLIKIEAGGKKVELKVSTTQMVFNNFLSGLAWGVGSVLGATVVVASLIYFLSQLNTAPLIGHFISHILETIKTVPVK